jgi:hypothetical protein
MTITGDSLGTPAEGPGSEETAGGEEGGGEQREGADDSLDAVGDVEDIFYDISQVPEEDRTRMTPVYKAMQKAYTQKTQKLSELRKTLEQGIADTEIMRNMMTAPEFERFLQLKEAGRLSGAPVAEVLPDGGAEETVEYDDPRVGSALKTLETGVNERIEQLENLQATLEAKIFAGTHPDWKQYGKQIKLLLRSQPGISMEDAYEMAKRPHLAKEHRELQRRVRELEATRRKDAIIENPDVPPTSTQRPRAGSFADAKAMALDGLGEATLVDDIGLRGTG